MVLIWLLLFCCSSEPGLIEVKGRAQGTTYIIKYVAASAVVSQAEVDSLFRVVDLSLSLYVPGSLINRFNTSGAVRMDDHLRAVVEKSIEVSGQSSGAFDITAKPMTDLWRGASVKGKEPSRRSISRVGKIVGNENLLIRNDSLFAKKSGVKIDCNGIAQGYTVDLISDWLDRRGAADHIVELGGEVRAKGKGPGGRSWTVGIERPMDNAGKWNVMGGHIVLNNKAVTTSGNYRSRILIGKKSYGHVMDPGTGYLVDNGIVAVTVIANTAMEADAWDNGFFVLGIERALLLLERRKDLHAHFVYMDAGGVLRDTASSGFRDHLK